MHGDPLIYDRETLQFKYANDTMPPPAYLHSILKITITQDDIDYLIYTWKPANDEDNYDDDDDGCTGELSCGCIDVCRGRCGMKN